MQIKSEEQALLAEIRALPEEDAPRLLYADWLEERGDPRSEFIRRQCELAILERNGNSAAEIVKERCQKMLEEHYEEWFAPLSQFGVAQPYFWRGFVEGVVLQNDEALSDPEPLLATAPLLRRLYVRPLPDMSPFLFLQQLAGSSLLPRLTGLSLAGLSGIDAAARQLFTSPKMANLVSLDLSRTSLGGAALRSLYQSTQLPALRTLNLSGNELDLRVLCNSPLAVRLKALRLSQCRLRDDDAEALAMARGLSRLERLDLSDNQITSPGAIWLTLARHLGSLCQLDLRRNPLSAAAQTRLVDHFGHSVLLSLAREYV